MCGVKGEPGVGDKKGGHKEQDLELDPNNLRDPLKENHAVTRRVGGWSGKKLGRDSIQQVVAIVRMMKGPHRAGAREAGGEEQVRYVETTTCTEWLERREGW